ncbi:secretion protein HlyD family protein [Psychromonas sp. CNPT3]|uniref:HlyD family secretion protein n=1 Tax=Psychromonas sp. CNPT3 TaxID=314282 RepID=UPI00006E78FD|nr:biotin/lipoyl-binding protein [Psychromonas sp. CNPT3]AGH82088.1 secretion protein HlyD family protein [Psychromonas sp. CNPT3]
MSNRLLSAIATIFIVLFLSYGAYLAYSPKTEVLQGQIEAREYNISSKVPGRIEQVMVKRGDHVQAGDILYAINSPELSAKLMQAEGGRDAANAMLLQADNGARKQQIQASKEQWKKASVAEKLAKTTYNRVQSLFDEGVIARQKRDEAFTQWQASKYTKQAAFVMYQMSREGARAETKAAAAGQVRVAEGMVNEVNAVLKDSQMRAPISAEVSEVLLQKGELAPSGFPVVSLIDMQDAWAVFQIREDQLKKFQQGNKVMLSIPALEKEAEFVVTYIAVMANFATWRATENGHDFDMRTFQVELKPSQRIENLRVGMSVLLQSAQ